MKYLTLEFYKLKRKKIFFMVFFFLLFQLLWGILATDQYLSKEAYVHGYQYTIMMFTTLNGTFFPILIGVIMSRICDIEHKNGMLKQLSSSAVSTRSIYFSKFLCCLLITFFMVLVQLIAIIAYGKIANFPGTFPITLIFSYGIGTLIISIPIIALQQWISITIENQMFPLTLGLIGGFIGTVAQLFPSIFQNLFIWAYFSKLSPMSFIVINNDNFTMQIREIPMLPIIASLIIGVLIYCLGQHHRLRKEF